MTYINTRGWLRRMGARIGGQVGLTGGANERAGGALPPTLYVKKRPGVHACVCMYSPATLLCVRVHACVCMYSPATLLCGFGLGY